MKKNIIGKRREPCPTGRKNRTLFIAMTLLVFQGDIQSQSGQIPSFLMISALEYMLCKDSDHGLKCFKINSCMTIDRRVTNRKKKSFGLCAKTAKTSLLLFCVIVVASTKRESTSTKEAAKAILLHDKDDRKKPAAAAAQCISLVDVAYTRCDNHRVWGPLEGTSPLIIQQQGTFKKRLGCPEDGC